MLIALISDVHTNIPAWQAVLEDWTRLEMEVTEVWSLGDWLGYSRTDPMIFWHVLQSSDHPAVIQLLRHPERHGVLGNHDYGIIANDIFEICPFNDRAMSALLAQRRQAAYDPRWRSQFLPWLQAQKNVLSPRPGVYLAHGAFSLETPERIPCHYTPQHFAHEWSLRQIKMALQNGPQSISRYAMALHGWEVPRLLITGHTHSQKVWQRAGSNGSSVWPLVSKASIPDERIREALAQDGPLAWQVQVRPTPERPLWINPGSVGMQRDLRTPRPANGREWARYALIQPTEADWSALIIHLRWVPYDPSS